MEVNCESEATATQKTPTTTITTTNNDNIHLATPEERTESRRNSVLWCCDPAMPSLGQWSVVEAVCILEWPKGAC